MTKYDYQLLLGVTFLTLLVLVLMVIGYYQVNFPLSQYYTLPIGWFVGAVMMWAWGKFRKIKSHSPVAQQ